jgi:DNA-binding response OmpR family regulator
MSAAVAERILIVEDERNLGETLQERLGDLGFDAVWAESVEAATSELSRRRYDLALLDVGLPDGNGFDLGIRIRAQHPSTALVFLTAMSTPEDRVRGLELGAEDYVAKPFHLKELILRVRNSLKRKRALDEAPAEITLGDCVVRFPRFEVMDRRGVAHSLSQKECALLKMLFERRGTTVSRDEILAEVWGDDEYPTTRTVDNFVLRLRKVLEESADEPRLIKSVRGVGYRLEAHL